MTVVVMMLKTNYFQISGQIAVGFLASANRRWAVCGYNDQASNDLVTNKSSRPEKSYLHGHYQ